MDCETIWYTVIYCFVNYNVAWIIMIWCYIYTYTAYVYTVCVYTLYIILYIPYKGTSIFNLKKETIKTRSFSKSFAEAFPSKKTTRRLRRISSLFALGAVGDTDWLQDWELSQGPSSSGTNNYAIDLLNNWNLQDSDFFRRFKMNLDWRCKHSWILEWRSV